MKKINDIKADMNIELINKLKSPLQLQEFLIRNDSSLKIEEKNY